MAKRPRIFSATYEVSPTAINSQVDLVEGAYAHCFVREETPEAADLKARFYVLKGEWKIKAVESPATEVTEKDFAGKDIGLEQFFKAREKGISIFYSAWAADGKTTLGPVQLEQPRSLDLSQFVGKWKELEKSGRCLHFESGDRCREIVQAHSIQKSALLSHIAEKGHVYTYSRNIGAFRNNSGELALEKRGIRKMSTFPGFCRKHDNDFFSPIDDCPLLPTEQQVFLYAYRSLCRELFVKENALKFLDAQMRAHPQESSLFRHLSNMYTGTTFGLKNLERHKAEYDTSLRDKAYADIEYVLFCSERKPNIAFSGLLYPDFDFLGRHLQDLSNHERILDLITMCSASMDRGWGFLLAWHKSSRRTCSEVSRSLATAVYHGASVEDALFRLLVSGCENIAFSPAWWDALGSDQKHQVTSRFTNMVSMFHPVEPDYLVKGLEGIAGWELRTVVCSDSRKVA